MRWLFNGLRIPRHRCVALLLAIAPLPALAAKTPDLSGPWQIEKAGPLRTVENAAPPLLPEAATAQQKTQALYQANHGADPMVDCLPPGVPRLLMQPFPFNLVQGRRTVGMMFEWNHLTRLIYLDREHFKPIGPLYLGQSIGHWEGDTLVIDTNHFNDTTWLDDFGLPHSKDLTTLERLRLIDGGKKLEDQITLTDPKTFSGPWSARLVFDKRPGVLIKEDYCLGRLGKGRSESR